MTDVSTTLALFNFRVKLNSFTLNMIAAKVVKTSGYIRNNILSKDSTNMNDIHLQISHVCYVDFHNASIYDVDLSLVMELPDLLPLCQHSFSLTVNLV